MNQLWIHALFQWQNGFILPFARFGFFSSCIQFYCQYLRYILWTDFLKYTTSYKKAAMDKKALPLMTYMKGHCPKFRHLKALNIFPPSASCYWIATSSSHCCWLLILHCASCITWLGVAVRHLVIGVWKPYQGRCVVKKKAHSTPFRCKTQDRTGQHVWKLKRQELPSFTACEKVISSKIHTA